MSKMSHSLKMKLCHLCVVILSAIIEYANTEEVNIPGLGVVAGTVTASKWTKWTIYSFYGIRYAKAPSGNRRFRPPEPVDPWEGEYDATLAGRVCPQLYNKETPFTYSTDEDFEDCLFLNVFTPSLPSKFDKPVRLPVMVYIHGGAFYEGSADAFPPNYLLEEDIVLVVIQYRLGPLGFLSLQTDGISGNYGLLDMVASLEWVKRHINAFGGDETRVTVVGQSAGAASISLMLMSPLVNDSLFHQAILQSGSGISSWVSTDDPLSFANIYFKELTNTTNAVHVDVMEGHFRNAKVQDLHRTLLRVLSRNPFAKASSVVVQEAGKGRFLEHYPVDLLRTGRIRTVPMMTGVTKHEGSLITTIIYKFLRMNDLLENRYYLRNYLISDVIKLFDIPDNDKTLAMTLETEYFAGVLKLEKLTFADFAPRLTDFFGWQLFKSDAFTQAKINANHSPTHLYTFDYAGQFTSFGFGGSPSDYPFDGGVHHSNDLLYLFPAYYDSLNVEDKKMAKTMVRLWTSFIKTGNPESPNVQSWNRFEEGSDGRYLHINTTLYQERDFGANEYRLF